MPIRFIGNAFDFIKITTFFGIRLNRMYFLQTIGSLWWLFCSVERQKKRFGTNHIKDELC